MSRSSRRTRVLRRYRDASGAARELVTRPAAQGSLLVVDRVSRAGGEERLVAHLSAEEPDRNALVAASVYLAASPEQRRCRQLSGGEELEAPCAAEPTSAAATGASNFRLRLLECGMSIPSLRWARPAVPGERGDWTVVSLRDAIAATESYEPFRAISREAVARHAEDPKVSITVLRAELGRVLESPIVLNRALRQAVLESVARGSTMSGIAARCGRSKRDARGNLTGETSWLARRIGLLPEGGQEEPTRWVHTDVLALIAREGLGVAPREVELG